MAHAGVIADSLDDWVAAINDGIGIGGTSVAAGSATDVAQHGHADSSGSGSWDYGWGTSGDGSRFAGGFNNFANWSNGSWTHIEGAIGSTGMSPVGGSPLSDPMVWRRWQSNGANTGQTLTVRVAATLRNAASDGVTLSIFGSGLVGGDLFLIPPSETGVEQVFEFDLIDSANANLVIGLRPEGVGPNDINNFFFDSTNVRVTILPSPGSAVLLAAGGIAMVNRRR
ncbi:MAG: hypothetical protein AAGB51_07520 [Planctomycetota bacterium]